MYSKFEKIKDHITSNLDSIRSIEIASNFNYNYLTTDNFNIKENLEVALDENQFYIRYNQINILQIDINNVTDMNIDNNLECLELDIFDEYTSVYIVISN